MNNRRIEILENVSKNINISVKQLADEFGVSQVTIRNDLKYLQQYGVLERHHGGANTISSDDIMKRMSNNYDIKSRIAKVAASLISDGETVMIESGSTNALFAKMLCEKKDISIITNSSFIARFVRECSSISVTLIGGDYQPESEVMVGPLARVCIRQFNVDKLFVGVDGFSEASGFTCLNLMRAEVARTMAERAQHIYILTDSSKFSSIGVATQFMSNEIDVVITDHDIPKESAALLKKNGVDIHIV